MNPSCYGVLKDAEESGKDPRNENSDSMSTRREHRHSTPCTPCYGVCECELLMKFFKYDVEESEKELRDEKSGNVIQAGENEMKKHASRQEGTPSRKPGESDRSTRRKHRRSSSRRSLGSTDQLKRERQMNPSREEKISRKHCESDSSTRREYRHSYSRTKQQYRHEPNDHSYKPHHERQRHHNCYNQKHYRYTQPINRKRRCRSPYEKFGYCRNLRRANNFGEKEKYRYRSPIRFIKGACHRKEYTPRYSYREQGRREQHVDASKDYEYKNVQRKKRARDYYENNDEEKRICPPDDESRVKKRRTENSEKAENKKCFDSLNDNYGNCSDDCSSNCSLKPNGANNKKYVRKGHVRKIR
ncbi:hypothetical protein QYM36_010898 [Artemia franciscana]|uniref:Uncharacterized protein n=1 Tax=Artemia franciscana TaxID=6661 RepID=A0AA88HTZ7_ARTSF|nr:hypothetical protein QYM36_010898 [Artemia franciscana]